MTKLPDDVTFLIAEPDPSLRRGLCRLATSSLGVHAIAAMGSSDALEQLLARADAQLPVDLVHLDPLIEAVGTDDSREPFGDELRMVPDTRRLGPVLRLSAVPTVYSTFYSERVEDLVWPYDSRPITLPKIHRSKRDIITTWSLAIRGTAARIVHELSDPGWRTKTGRQRVSTPSVEGALDDVLAYVERLRLIADALIDAG